MALNYYFFNAVESGGVYDRIYNADDICSYLDKLVGNGVFPNPSTNLQVTESSPAGMSVTISPGDGWINGHKMSLTTPAVVSIDAADPLLDRIDEVIFYVDLTSRSMGVEVLKGSPAASPVAVPLTRTNQRYEMVLAKIYVAKQTATITDSMISDERGNSSLCGYVQGLIQQISTTTLWEQFRAEFYEWFDAVRGQFDDFKRLTKLEYCWKNTTDYLHGFQIRTYIPSYSSEYDIVEIYVSGSHRSKNQYTLTDGYVSFLDGFYPRNNAEIDIVVYHMTPDPE